MADQVGRLLVVDDEEAVRELVALAAEAAGWSCDAAGSIADVARRLPADYDLVLVDLQLGPEDGASVLELLGRRQCRAAVLLMSGGGDQRFDSAAVTATAEGLQVCGSLHKPFPLAQLRAVLASRAAAAR